MTELYKKYRPKQLNEIVGQEEAVKVLRSMGKAGRIPHALLFHGPSGCGKTTLARIVRRKLKCSDSDFQELNCADFRGVDMVRDIRQQMTLAPMGGSSRVWLIDEAHQLTSQAQNAFLKILEDTPEHVYFMLCTTDPHKLLKTVRTRCTDVPVKLLGAKQSQILLDRIAGMESMDLNDEVQDKLVEYGEGSPRKILVLLSSILGIDEVEEQLSVLEAPTVQQQAITLARTLMKPKPSWKEVASILKEVEEDPETVRHIMLGYFNSVLLGGGKFAGRAFAVIEEFEDPFYNSKKAGLSAACWRVLHN